jgi:hypothetical protein
MNLFNVVIEKSAHLLIRRNGTGGFLYLGTTPSSVTGAEDSAIQEAEEFGALNSEKILLLIDVHSLRTRPILQTQADRTHWQFS